MKQEHEKRANGTLRSPSEIQGQPQRREGCGAPEQRVGGGARQVPCLGTSAAGQSPQAEDRSTAKGWMG